jgi:hypothetical protein
MVTGSMASNFWGIPRSTHDLDFVVQIPPTAVAGVVKEFSDNFFMDEDSVRAAFRPPHQFNAIDRRSALKVDFWMSAGSPFEREMFIRRQRLPMLGEPAWDATPEDIILHKLFWNRITPSERQLSDAAGVWLVQRVKLDLNYLRHWAVELDVQKSLQDLLDDRIKPKHT